MNVTFNTPFDEQLAFFRQKLNLPTAHWDDIMKAAHDRSFVVAGAAQADLLADLKRAVDKTLAHGFGLAEFERDFKQIVHNHGWNGWTGQGTKAGEAWRMKVIVQTNMATSYAAGRYAQLTDPDFVQVAPYWRYVHDDSVWHPRPEHQAWGDAGLTLRYDDPFWQTHFPPNGWGCQCRVTPVPAPEKGDATEPPDGWDQRDEDGNLPGVDKGFDYAPGASVADELRALVNAKVAKLPEPLAQALLENVAATLAGLKSEELALGAGDLIAPSLSPAQREARDYVVENGRRTGNEYGVAIADGEIVDRFTSDSANGLQVPRGYGLENGPVEIHHNHPMGDSFSVKDIAILLARNELGAVAVHGHAGFYAQVERVVGAVSEETAMAVVLSAKSKAKLLLTQALKANIVSFEQINSGLWQVVMALFLEEEGVVHYTANSDSLVTLARKVVRRG